MSTLVSILLAVGCLTASLLPCWRFPWTGSGWRRWSCSTCTHAARACLCAQWPFRWGMLTLAGLLFLVQSAKSRLPVECMLRASSKTSVAGGS